MSPIKDPTELGGMLGESLSVRKVNGRVIIKNRAVRKVSTPPTDKQIAIRDKFVEANKYAGRQIAQPAIKEMYATGVDEKKKTPFLVALSDFLVAPRVTSIDTFHYRGGIGDKLIVNAIDDFMVTEVIVTITDASGAIIEEGEAGPDAEGVHLWAYTATVANATLAGTKIQAMAFDRPGNRGSAEVVL